ncbi:MAG: hypothetical protein ACRECV_16235, partial [Xanthobacteraceae bacterium]
GKAPLFQEVQANQKSLDRYVADLAAACKMKGAEFRFGTDVAAAPELLSPFDRVVVATGARYRFGLGVLVVWALDHGAACWPSVSGLLSSPKLRDWFYYRGRSGTAERFKGLTRPGQIVTIIGDAARAGKSKQAIASAFEAALLGK